MKKKLAEKEKTLGQTHQTTLLFTVNDVGLYLYKQGKLGKAEVYYRCALEEGYERTLGRDHPHTRAVSNSLRVLSEKMEKEK